MKKTILKSLIRESMFRTEASNFDTIFNSLGYNRFDDFIEDNPGGSEALKQWIETIPEFVKKLSNEFDTEELEDLGIYISED